MIRWLCSGVQRLPTTTESTKSIRHPLLHDVSTLTSITIVVIDCELLKCERVVLLFVFLDGKFVPAPQSLDMN